MEQRDQTPEPPSEDIGRAAAEASAQADEYSPASDDRDPDVRRPRRWLVVGGVAVAALAVAGTAAAIAGRSHPTAEAATVNAAASSSAQITPTLPPTSSQNTATTDATDPATPSGSTAPTTPPSTSAAKTSPSPTKSSPTRATTTDAPDGEGGDCENETHDTPSDEARKFSGMTRGTQEAYLSAQKAAQAAGITFYLNSGYRSADYQQRIFDCWVKQLGSQQAARQYALPPNESAHVQGYAMDIAPPAAAAWLESTKGQYGLCRRYADETWHFEYQSRYKTQGCPALLPHP